MSDTAPGPVSSARIISRIEDLESIRDGWERLQRRFSSPLLGPDWFMTAAASLLEKDRLRVNVIESGAGEVAAIAPFALHGRHPDGLELIGSSTLREPGGLLYRDIPSLTAMISGLLEDHVPFRLHRIPKHGEVETLLRYLPARNGHMLLWEDVRLPRVQAVGTWEAFERGRISSSRRSSFRRLERRIRDLSGHAAELDVRRPSPEELTPLFEQLLIVEDSGWKGRTGSSIRRHPGANRFFSLYARRRAEAGTLVVFSLRAGSSVLAMQLAELHADRLWIYKIGYDEAWAACSPGVLLMNRVLRFCFDEGLEGCEFLGSHESWLDIWANDIRSCVSVRVYPRSVSGLAARVRDDARTTYHNVRNGINSRWHRERRRDAQRVA